MATLGEKATNGGNRRGLLLQTEEQSCRSSVDSGHSHEDVKRGKRFPHYWPTVCRLPSQRISTVGLSCSLFC